MKKYEDVDQDFVKEVLNSTYVDDLSSGSSSVEEAFQLFLKSKARIQEVGFRMRKWSSNSPQLMERIKSHERTAELSGTSTSSVKEEDQSFTDCTLGGGHVVNEAEEHKVLGIIWNHSSDQLSIDLNKVIKNVKLPPATKRSVLKCMIHSDGFLL